MVSASLRRFAVAALLVFPISLDAQAGVQTVTIETVLTRAASYVATFVERLSNVIAEEQYRQTVRRPTRGSGGGNTGSALQFGSAPESFATSERRQIKSDLVLLKDTTPFGWTLLRDVFEVDGKPVHDREDRLARLFADSTNDGRAQAVRIADESARYNLGPGIRTTNTPELSILLLQASLQSRFEFSLGSPERSLGATARVIEFREQARPTLVRGEKGQDIPATGRFWLDVTTGQVLKSEVHLRLPVGRWTLTTTFKPDATLGIAPPAEMDEYYQIFATEVTGTATYGGFRRFGVDTSERVKEQ
jgi:hypothetical protein